MTDGLPAEMNAANFTASDMPVTPGSLRLLAKERLLSAVDYERILSFIDARPNGGDWANFGLRCLLLTGLLFCVAGVICFFAWNWAAMSHFLKFGIIIALMLVCAGVTLWREPDSLTGGLALLATGLLAGPLLAIYGQYYQTGADAWELFRAWALFLIPLALVGRQNALWLAAWLMGSLWASLYIQQIVLAGHWTYFAGALSQPLFLAGQLAVLIVGEALMYRARNRAGSFLQHHWPARIVAVCLLIVLTSLAAEHIIDYGDVFDDGLKGSAGLQVLLYLALVIGGLAWYRKMRSDMLLATLLLLSIIVQIMTFLFTAFDLFNGAGMLFAAIVLMGLGFGAAQLVLRWQRHDLGRKALAERESRQRLAHLKTRLVFVRNYMQRDLWQALDLPQSDAAAQALGRSLAHLTPWYIRLMLTVCAWVAAIFLMAFLGFVISFTFDDSPELSLLVFSVIFIIIATILTRLESLFLSQFGLALGLAGALALPASIIWLLEMDSWFHIPVLISFIICYFAIPHQAMRCLAAFVCIFIGLDLLAGFFNFIFRLNWEVHNSKILAWTLYLLSIPLTVALLTPTLIAMFKAWRNEAHWVQDPARDAFIRPLLIATAAAFLCFGGLWCAVGAYGWQGYFWMYDVYPRYAFMLALFRYSGLAAGLALVYLAVSLPKSAAASPAQKGVIIAGAVLALIAGWWLPWLPIALVMLALSRYLGSMALTGLTAFYLAACVGWYYFSMQTSLLYKAYTLLGAGLIMLGAGYAIYRLFNSLIALPRKGGEHA